MARFMIKVCSIATMHSYSIGLYGEKAKNNRIQLLK